MTFWFCVLAFVVCQFAGHAIAPTTPDRQTALGFLLFAIWMLLMIWSGSFITTKEKAR